MKSKLKWSPWVRTERESLLVTWQKHSWTNKSIKWGIYKPIPTYDYGKGDDSKDSNALGTLET